MEKISNKIKRNKILILKLAFLVIFIVIIGFLLGKIIDAWGNSPREIAGNIRNLGVLAPIVAISFFALEVIFTPLPGMIMSIASGFAFGGFWGAVYTYAGNMLGTAIAFYLSRRFGRPVIEKLVNKKQLDKYDCFFKEKGRVLLWVVYLLPFLPNDVTTFVIGLTDIKWRDFIFIVSISLIPYTILLNYFGATIYDSGISELTTVLGIILILALMAGVFIYLALNKRKRTC